MKIRILNRRHSKGAGKGIKLGRSRIKNLSEDDFQELKRSIQSGFGTSSRRQAKHIKRVLTLMRRAEGETRPLIIRQGFRSSEVLDSLYPKRKDEWLPSWKRSRDATINLTNFSFIDYPIETLAQLRTIAESECICRTISINFDDDHCRDISPYMVLGLLRQKMLPVVVGGRIKKRISRVIHAVHLNEYLRMAPRQNDESKSIWPFPLRQRRSEATSSKFDDTAWSVTSEERVDTKLADTIDEWLGALRPPFELSETGRGNVLTLIGEILDNAKRHSHVSEDGTWAIAGFMEARRRESEKESVAFVCHLAIISPGMTIYESLQRAPSDIKDRITAFAERHLPQWPIARKYDNEALWTLASLQDGISRVLSTDQSINGFGMMTLVEMVNALGHSTRADEQPRLTIVSGRSCLMIRPPYGTPRKTEEGHRVLALNPSNDLKYPPEEQYVFSLPYRFPGTVVAARFCLDSKELNERNNNR